MIEQRTVRIGDRMLYCYADGSIEYTSRSDRDSKQRIIKTIGVDEGNGYKGIHLKVNGKNMHLKVHRLIALAFRPNPNGLPEVDHINRNKIDNRPENLRWVDSKTNNRNREIVDKSIKKYGVRSCHNRKIYQSAYGKEYRASHPSLVAMQPNGKRTTFNFPDTNDPFYKILQPLSMLQRYLKYNELKKGITHG